MLCDLCQAPLNLYGPILVLRSGLKTQGVATMLKPSRYGSDHCLDWTQLRKLIYNILP